MKEWIFPVLTGVGIEGMLVLIYLGVARWLSPNKNAMGEATGRAGFPGSKPGKIIRITWTSWLKGWLERMFLVFLLLAGFEGAAIIVFGAIKLGTRVDRDKEEKVSNDYFLVGNIISIAAGVTIWLLFKDLISLR